MTRNQECYVGILKGYIAQYFCMQNTIPNHKYKHLFELMPQTNSDP